MKKEVKLTKKLEKQLTEIYAKKYDIIDVNQVDKETSEYKKFIKKELKREVSIRKETSKYFKENKERIIDRLLDSNTRYSKEFGEGITYNDLTSSEKKKITKMAREDFKKTVEETKAVRILSGAKTTKLRGRDIVKATGERKYFKDPKERQEETITKLLRKKGKVKTIKEALRTLEVKPKKFDPKKLKYQSGAHWKIDGKVFREYRYFENGEEIIVLIADYDPTGKNDNDVLVMTKDIFEAKSKGKNWTYVKNKK